MLLLFCLLAVLDLFKGGHIVAIRTLVDSTWCLEHDADRLVPCFELIVGPIVTVGKTGTRGHQVLLAALRDRASVSLVALRLPLYQARVVQDGV